MKNKELKIKNKKVAGGRVLRVAAGTTYNKPHSTYLSHSLSSSMAKNTLNRKGAKALCYAEAGHTPHTSIPIPHTTTHTPFTQLIIFSLTISIRVSLTFITSNS